MTDDTELIKKRLTELARRSYNSGIYTFSDFLSLSEQSALQEIRSDISFVKYTLFGGVGGAERVMVRFGEEGELGYELPFPIVTAKVHPVSEKFAEQLTHRDYLGAILNLGIERSVVGDIVIRGCDAFVFIKDSISEYFIKELTRVRHTDVKVTLIDGVPEGELYKTESKRIQLSSERLDATVAKVFNLSREDAQRLFLKRLVFASGKEISSCSYTPKPDEIISVRGHGRFIYRGFESNTKRGRLNVLVDVYV
ncbi:MAG: hypothetical protein J6Q85_00850 [Clostridia bacterium]|nr:hypothetical protein [Clostridia bacterium]